MERKLLSLPSFFVLLLVAGIAFLAAPVVDVYAALSTGNNISVGRKTSPADQATPANVTTAGDAVFVISFATLAVKVTGETLAGSTVSAEDGFGVEDILVTFTQTHPTAAVTTRSPTSAEFAKADATLTAGQGQNFEVTLAIPSNVQGTLAVSIRAFASGTVEFEEAADASATYDATSSLASGNITYNTRDTDAPTAAFAAGLEISGGTGTTTDPFTVTGGTDEEDLFQVEITITDNKGIATSGAGAFVVSTTPANSDVKLTTTLANPPATAPTTDPSVIRATWVKGTATATSVTHVVVINPANGAATVKIEVMKDSVTDTATPANKIAKTEATVTLSVPPTVMISVMVPPAAPGGSPTAVPDPIPTTFTFPIEVTLQLSAAPTATSGNDRFLEDDITVTNGTLQAGSLSRSLTTPPTATVAATYTATVTLPAAADRKSPFTIAVAASRFKAGTLDNTASNTVSHDVTVPPTGPATRPPDPMGTTGTALTGGKRGFSFDLPAMSVPAAANSADRFVVLAKAGTSNDNGVSASNVIDIKDEAWVDLADFLAYDGGTIYLIGPNNTTKHDLVINEVMWGGDAYLSDPSRSQWIELYNTKTTLGGGSAGSIAAGEWTIEFRAGIGPSTPPANMSDNFSNRELGNAHWEIPNVSGGKYGQGGRTQTTAGVSGSLRDLVSMRRKTDYDKIEKNDHKPNNATENRTEQLKGVPDGALAGSWEASTSRVNMSGTRKGTPGARHVVVVGTTGISKSVVFNEIANRSDKKFDWIELYNPGSSDVKINNWVLSKVTGVDKDDKLFKFESDENIVVPAKGFLLVVNEDPSETALAAGENVDNPNSRANGLPTKIYINSGLDIPKEKYLLILRTEEKLKSHEKIVDIGGHLGDLNLTHAGSATELWPLKAWKKIKTDDLGENNDKTWVRDKGKDLYHADAWKSDGGVTGLGIDRSPDSNDGPTSGTPGFDNGAVKDKVKDLTASDPVVISEIMFGSGNNRVPQWIELYNPSKTQAVKLNAWRLEVQNTIDANESLNVEFNYTLILPDVRIQPNQTVLIVSSSTGDATRDRFPKDRIINIWSTRSLRDITEMSSPRDAILSSVGFYMKLSDPEKQVVDEVGNIDSNRRTADDPAWDLPGGNLDEGGRASMIRREGTFGDGTVADSWISAAITDGAQKVGINELYYGHESDVGTPGYRAGGPLPVQLSSFYSKRNDAGAVIITWSTESELDNAGFNILRSLSRVGEFTRINAQLIPGAGTTGEKNTYTWTDTSARPNVVYYYQIEDVSLDGEHRTLRTTRLRGYVGAAGKATTIWGELKSRD